ncbi:MAG: hypothetical protein U0929_09340 [Planctomycetaceae bacterium]
MHLLQVCNVGSVVGGTAACAWSLARAWPQLRHSVAFLSPADSATRQAFCPHHVETWSHCTASRIKALQPDMVILHNVGKAGAELWDGAFTIQYVHSVGSRLQADQTVYCSRWLARQVGASEKPVLWQGVPVPPSLAVCRHRFTDRLRIGRICTPSMRKWPESLLEFYAELASRHPQVDWEFIGCPVTLQPRLLSACRGQARFILPSWQARSHLWEWDALLYHHPTLTESFGRTLAEAARAGCVPIVDHRGGFVEQLEVVSGFGCRTLTEFSNAIAALGNVSTRRSLSQQVQVQANAVFSLSAFAHRLSTLVDRMVTP